MRLSLTALIVVLFSSLNAFADCNQEQAFNKMMALNQQSAKLQATLPDPRKDSNGYNASYKQVMAFGTRLASAGPLLAAQKFNEACAVYDQLAKDYKINLENSSTLTLSELEKDGGKGRGGKCTLTDAALKMADVTQLATNGRAQGTLSDEKFQLFSSEANRIGIVMNEDPSKACEMIAALTKKLQ